MDRLALSRTGEHRDPPSLIISPKPSDNGGDLVSEGVIVMVHPLLQLLGCGVPLIYFFAQFLLDASDSTICVVRPSMRDFICMSMTVVEGWVPSAAAAAAAVLGA